MSGEKIDAELERAGINREQVLERCVKTLDALRRSKGGSRPGPTVNAMVRDLRVDKLKLTDKGILFAVVPGLRWPPAEKPKPLDVDVHEKLKVQLLASPPPDEDVTDVDPEPLRNHGKFGEGCDAYEGVDDGDEG